MWGCPGSVPFSTLSAWLPSLASHVPSTRAQMLPGSGLRLSAHGNPRACSSGPFPGTDYTHFNTHFLLRGRREPTSCGSCFVPGAVLTVLVGDISWAALRSGCCPHSHFTDRTVRPRDSVHNLLSSYSSGQWLAPAVPQPTGPCVACSTDTCLWAGVTSLPLPATSLPTSILRAHHESLRSSPMDTHLVGLQTSTKNRAQ